MTRIPITKHGEDHRPPLTYGGDDPGGSDPMRWLTAFVEDHASPGSGIMFDTDPQSGDWLIVTTVGQTTRTFFDPAISSSFPYSVVFEMSPSTLGSGRGMLVTASGDGSPQLHALDVGVNPTGGIAKGIFLTSNPTGSPTLIVMGDTDVEASTAGLTIGWRSFIHATGASGQATGGAFVAQSDLAGSATGVIATGLAATDNAVGVLAQAGGGGTSTGVDSTVSGGGTGIEVAYKGTTAVGSGGPEGYGLRLFLSQTGGGTTHLHPFDISVNGTVIFRIDANGNVHTKTGATYASDL